MVVLNELEVNSLFCEGLFVVGFGKESTVIAKLAGLDEQHVSNRERLNFDHRSKHMPGNCRRPLSPSFYQLILQFHFGPTRRRSPSDAPVLSLASAASERLLKISDRALESVRELGCRLPSEPGPGQGYVGLALPRIIGPVKSSPVSISRIKASTRSST